MSGREPHRGFREPHRGPVPGAVTKRLLDVAAASAGLLVLSPVLAALAVGVRLRLGAPVLFRQARPGLHGRPFAMLKFRTMTDARDAEGRPLPDAERLTPFGRLLRSTTCAALPPVNFRQGEP